MSETATKILDAALMLIQSRGYSAFSYGDIAEQLGIKKASIHYHFATKSDLGVAVVKRYARDLSDLMKQAKTNSTDPWQLLDVYFSPFRKFGDASDLICLCGALAGEFLALPKPVQEEVSRFFDANQAWLSQLLDSGRQTGAFDFVGSSKKESQLIFSALQGSLLVKRTHGSSEHLESVIATLKTQLKPAQHNG